MMLFISVVALPSIPAAGWLAAPRYARKAGG